MKFYHIFARRSTIFPLTTRCIARISLLLRPTSSSSILKTRLNEGEHERRPTGYEEGSCASKLDSSSLHFSSPSAAIHYNTDPWNFFWLIIPGSRPTFAGPYFYIPVRTCLRENRYRFDSVPPLPSSPFVRGTEGTIGSPISDTRIYIPCTE